MIDHRKLGRELELFESDPLIGAGLPIWLPAGAAARHAVESYLVELERRAGYRQVYSPPMGRRELYEISGHWSHFAGDMFPPMRDGSEELVLRPSLCPHHALAYRSRGRSYRELPLRISEIGGMYRAERSGVLGGLNRVRAIALNDAHLFCRESQASEEIAGVLQLMSVAHKALGIEPAGIRLSLRGPGREYGGRPEDWVAGERILREALDGQSYVDAPGDAAFYAPKIDVQIVDPADRESTLATVQIDFYQPRQFELSYVDENGEKRRPVMVHRSLAGSMERLFAHLIEVHAGAFPAWYAPVQVGVLPVGAEQEAEAAGFAARCIASGLRAEAIVGGSLGARIRAAHRVPYLVVIGESEARDGTVSVRRRDGQSSSRQVAEPVAEALAGLGRDCAAPL
jgi:threonyl-tRNA synthetase